MATPPAPSAPTQTTGATAEEAPGLQLAVRQTTPEFVPTQVLSPELTALKSGLKTLGSQGPQQAQFVQRVYAFSKQFLNQATE